MKIFLLLLRFYAKQIMCAQLPASQNSVYYEGIRLQRLIKHCPCNHLEDINKRNDSVNAANRAGQILPSL